MFLDLQFLAHKYCWVYQEEIVHMEDNHMDSNEPVSQGNAFKQMTLVL